MPSSTPKWEETEAVPTWEESSPIGTQTITEPARKIATQQTIPSPFNYLTGPGFKQTQEQIGAFGQEPLAEKWKTATTSAAPLPRFEVKQDDTFIKGLAKESANQLIGLPEFMFTTPAGIATAGVGPLAGKVGGTAIRLGYLADTIYNFLRQAPSDVEAFTKATPGEKGAMIARWVGTGALAGTLASPEISRAGDAIKRAAPILPRAAAAAEKAIAEQPAAEPAAQPEVTSASEIRSSTEIPEREVRAPVGQETPLRQQGQPAVAGAPEAQAPEVAQSAVESAPVATTPAEPPRPPTVTAEGQQEAAPSKPAALTEAAPISRPAEAQSAGKGGGATTAEPAAKPSALAASEPEVKQPWEMTKEEYLSQSLYDVTDTRGFGTPGGGPTGNIASVITGLTKGEAERMAERQNKEAREKYGQSNPVKISPSKEKGTAEGHRRMVEDAKALGKSVPPEVLADYPDLVAGAKTEGKAYDVEQGWKANVRYLDNPAGPLKGAEEIWQTDKPKKGESGVGAFGRYVVQSVSRDRPQRKVPKVEKPSPSPSLVAPAEKPAEAKAEAPSGLKIVQDFDADSGETNYKVIVPKDMIESKPGGYRIGSYATAVTPRTPEGDYVFTSGYARTPKQALEKLAYQLTPERAGVSEGASTMAEMLSRRATHEAVAEPIRAAIGEAFRPIIKKPMNTALADMQASNTPAIWIDDQVITPNGKYEVGKVGILKKVQDLSQKGFEKNLEQIETWTDREKAEGKAWAANKAAKELMEKRAVEREAKAKKVEADIAERKRIDESIRADREAYDKEVEAVELPKGKTKDVSIPMRAESTGKTSVEVKPMTAYGDLAIRKNELSSSKSGYKYFVTHVPTGLGIGNELKIQTLKEAQRLIKALVHTGVDLSKKEFTNEELGKLASAKSAWEDGRKSPQWWLDQRANQPSPPAAPPEAGQGKGTLPSESVASDWTSATAEPTELHAGIPISKFANRKMSQLDEATTQHSVKVQKSFDEARRAQREINKAVPSERRQAAISVWREAGGDIPTLQGWAAVAKGKMFKQAAIDAQNLTPEEVAIANKAIAAFQVLEARGNRFDVLNSHRDNYIPHVWDVKPPGHGVGFGGGMLKQRFKFSKARTFNNFFEGDQAGFIPKTLAIGKLLPAYIHEMNRVIADRQLVADIVNRKGSDGRDLAVPTGNVTTVENEGGKAVLVKPQSPRVPDTTDYKQMPNQPALSKWTWEGKDTEGKPVFVRADLALHPEAYRRLNSIIGQSALRAWYHDPAPGLAQVPRAVLRGLDYAQSAMKREMFGLLAPFHQVQEGTHAIGHVVNPFYNIPKIDMRRPDMMDAANHGLMLLPDRTSARVYLEGVGTQSSLTSQTIRKAGPIGRAISDVIDGYQDYLFHQYIPGLKFKTYEALLGRNMKLYADELSAGTMTPADVKITSAEQANAAYGHLNYALLDRNPTIQHIIQLAALAPDFLEARTRFAGQAVKGLTSKVGHEQFKAIAILAAVQAGSAFVLSNLLGSTYDPKHPFEVIYKGRRYSMRSVPEDTYNLLKDTHQFIYSRVNPLTVKGTIQLLTGLNYRGEKVSSLDTMEELLAGYIPITARAIPGIRSLTETSRQNPVSPLQQLAGSLGLRVSRYSPISETYKRAGAWMDSQKIDRSKGSYPVSKYQQLRYALEDGDMDRAKGEYMALAKTMTPSKIDAGFRQSMRHPFTDSAAHDVQFAASLKGYDRQLYDQALRTRQQILNAFSALPNYR